MASASPTTGSQITGSPSTRETWEVPATFKVTQKNQKFNVTFSNTTYSKTQRWDSRNTSAKVVEYSANGSVRNTSILTGSNIFCRYRVNQIKFDDKHFTQLCDEEQMNAIQALINKTKTIFVDTVFPLRLVLTTIDPKDLNQTITEYVPESADSTASTAIDTMNTSTHSSSAAGAVAAPGFLDSLPPPPIFLTNPRTTPPATSEDTNPNANTDITSSASPPLAAVRPIPPALNVVIRSNEEDSSDDDYHTPTSGNTSPTFPPPPPNS